MRRWFARPSEVQRLEKAVQALVEGLAGFEAREEEARREREDLHALIDALRSKQDDDRVDADERVRVLEGGLRKAEEDRLGTQKKLEIGLLKLQRIIDLQAEQMGRAAAGLLDRIEGFRGTAPGADV
jgi:hypothetical protein